MNAKFKLRRLLTLVLVAAMLVTAVPINLMAADYDVHHIGDKQINHKELDVKVVKADNAKEYIANPKQPDIYTYRTDFKTRRGERYIISYQPYVASVGAAASDDEKKKVNRDIPLPDLPGYDKARLDDSFKIDYDTVVKNANATGNTKTGNAENGFRYEGREDYKYKAKSNMIVVKHTFQSKSDFTKYTNPDETITDSSGKYIDNYPDGKTKGADGLKSEKLTKQWGNTGSTVIVSPLEEEQRPGYIPEEITLSMQVPDDAKDFKLEYRYNLAHYEIEYDTKGGTPLDNRTVYYSQEIPNIDKNSIPTKEGCDFLGWKPSHDIEDKDGTKYKKDAIIKKTDGKPSEDLDLHLIMPALRLGEYGNGKEKLTFTAVWEDKPKANYAIQFWSEKADHAENASISEKYEYIGTRVYKDADTGSTPDIDNEPVKDIKFPDLDDKRLAKIYNGAKFNRGKDLFLNKFYVYNNKLTNQENLDPKTNEIKTVSATGKTVYNIYYDRQVYTLYFTKSNALGKDNKGVDQTFYPEIYGRDQKKNELVKLGGPGKPYHYKARFNELMYGWPNDAMQTKGFTPGYQSFGWGPNYDSPKWPVHLDTPPYRLNADQFLDMAGYDNWGGYTKKIDKGDGTTIDLDKTDFTTLSFGIKQETPSIPHHMDFWMDGFKDGETIIRYDLVRTKADTADPQYTHRYPTVQGFTPYASFIREENQEDGRVNEDSIDELNDAREGKTPYPGDGKEYYNIFGFNSHVGELKFIPAFFSNADEFGDPLGGEKSGFKENGYLQFHYKRKKYPLRFNYDPTAIKGDNEFNATNSLKTFYEFPLKVLSPDLVDSSLDRDAKEYFKKDPKNLLDNPENLQTLGLTDLVYKDTNDNDKLKVKRPTSLSDQMIFKGWALDPAGKKMVWENPKETMPNHPVHLFAIWGEPDYKWKVTFDPDGGDFKTIKEDKLTTKTKKIQEGDIGQEEIKTYPVKGYLKEPATDGDKQIFTVIQRQKLVEPLAPEKKGYDFMGWEVIRYKKNAKGEYTDERDTDSYRNKYGVPELYTFGNDVVSPLYLKAIWIPNQRTDIKVEHYFLDKDYNLAKTGKRLRQNPDKDILEDKRAGLLAAAMGDRQNNEYILIPKEELPLKDESGNYVGGNLHDPIKTEYEKYNDRVKQNNSFFQTFRVEPEKIPDPSNPSELKDNPNFKDNVFKFYYRPFRKREYKVNYVDERGKAEIEGFYKGLELIDINGLEGDALLEANKANKAKFEKNKNKLEEILKKYAIVAAEDVSNGNRHYDARNYRPIKGWKLDDKAQKQLFFDVNEDTNEFLGINGTGSDQIFFYYEDVRVIKVDNPKDPVPDGYVRLTFKIDEKNKGGVFKDKDDKEAKELYYDVIKGLSSTDFPHPIVWEEGKAKEANRYYITADDGKKFVKWDNIKWLNKNTKIIDNYTFTAYFDWAGAAANPMVVTESFEGDNGKWINNFAPTIETLKKQIVWKAENKDTGEIEDKPLPAGTTVAIVNDNGDTLTDKDVYDLVNEKKAADKDELVRTVNIKAKVTFKDGKTPQELDIPITVYKNVYEALNKEGDKPLFLKEAEGKEAKDGGLKDVTGNYVMVTIKADKDFNAKNDKVYWVNKNAWVEIPEVSTDGDTRFTKWTADKDAQNDNGMFDFKKRHKFTEDTVITPQGAKDVVEQTDPAKKPDVPESYVKVIVKTTDKATDATAFEKTFWVNPSVDVTIPVTNPTGKENQKFTFDGLGEKDVNYIFKEWQKVQTGETDDSLADVNPVEKIELTSHKYTDKITVIEAAYKKSIQAEKITDPLKTKKLDTPQGKEITDEILKGLITPQEGKEIDSIEVISKPDGNTVGDTPAKVIVKYKDGTTQGTNKNPVVIPVEVHKNIVPADANGEKPKEALANYVKVILKAGEGGTFEETLTNSFTYYVSPEVEVDFTTIASQIKKKADTGYIVNGEKWTNKDNKTLKGTFTDQKTIFEFTFDKSKDIVEKTDDTVKKPDGYVEVIFKTEDENKGKLDGDKLVKIYYVNPKAEIKLVELADGQTAGEKQLAVPKTAPATNYKFDQWYEEIDTETAITSERIHVAKFKLAKVTLTYNAGEGTGTVPPVVKVDHGTKVVLARPDGLSKENATFAGWKIGETTYQVGDEVTLNENTTATAQWSASIHTVRFDTKGGSDVDDQKVVHGQKLTDVTEPKLDGKVFTGWKEKGKESQQDPYFDLNSDITEDKILVAQWQDPVQKIGENDTVESQFIKVIFNKGDHGELYIDNAKQESPLTYKVEKTYNMTQAIDNGLVVPKAIANTYYKLKEANDGWDNALALNGQDITFTAQYELTGDVIPVDTSKSETEADNERPTGMLLIKFKVPEDRAFMTGPTMFYVKANTKVKIKTPIVHRKTEDFIFNGWDLAKDDDGNCSFSQDRTIENTNNKKPNITFKLPNAGNDAVSIESMTDGAQGYLELTRGNKTTKIEAEYDDDYGMYFFVIPESLGEQLMSGDVLEVYAIKGGIKSDVRTYEVK